MNLTDDTTERIFNYLQAYIREHQTPPSIREIASGCFVSVGTVMRHLDRLEFTQRITRIPGQARSIRLLKLPPEK